MGGYKRWGNGNLFGSYIENRHVSRDSSISVFTAGRRFRFLAGTELLLFLLLLHHHHHHLTSGRLNLWLQVQQYSIADTIPLSKTLLKPLFFLLIKKRPDHNSRLGRDTAHSAKHGLTYKMDMLSVNVADERFYGIEMSVTVCTQANWTLSWASTEKSRGLRWGGHVSGTKARRILVKQHFEKEFGRLKRWEPLHNERLYLWGRVVTTGGRWN